MSAVDFLLLGLAAGLAFQLVEDTIRRLELHNPSDFQAFGLAFHNPSTADGGWAEYQFSLLSGWSNSYLGRFWAGHHISTAVVMAGIGVLSRAFRHSYRWAKWAGALLLLWFVTYDQVLVVTALAGVLSLTGVGLVASIGFDQVAEALADARARRNGTA